MTITRGFATTAMLAVIAVGAAAPASAAPAMSGHYVMTATKQDGSNRTFTHDWFFTPCGDGCANLTTGDGHTSQARLLNGQWTMDLILDSSCSDGTNLPNGMSAHYTWDPNTLAGTNEFHFINGACPGDPQSGTNNIQLKQAP